MSDTNKKLTASTTYDLTKNIKDIEVNTGFILGLDAILLYFISNVVEDPSTLTTTFKKFDLILTNNTEEPIELSMVERYLYTLFALQQLFKAKAKEQNLEIPVETEATQEDMLAYMKSILANDQEDAAVKLKKIQDLTKIKSS